MTRLENVLKTSLQDALKMSWRHFCKTCCWGRLCKKSWRCLEDVLEMSSKRLEDVLKTYGQDEYIGLDQDVFKTSSEDVWLRRIYSSRSRRLEDVFIKTNIYWEVFEFSQKITALENISNLKSNIIVDILIHPVRK